MVDIIKCNSMEEWNGRLLGTTKYGIFSTFQWGEYKTKKGWVVDRLLFYHCGNFLGMSQLIYKKRLGVIVGWTNSGINYVDVKYLADIVKSIKNYFYGNFFYERFSFFEEHNPCKVFEHFKILDESSQRINSNFTIIHDLQNNSNINLSANHRYYYKKSLKNNLEFKIEYDADNFIKIHTEMTNFKNRSDLVVKVDDIKCLIDAFEDNYFFANVYLNNVIVSSCLVLFFGNMAYYYLAGSNNDGRRVYASYFMVVNLLNYLLKNNFIFFDFMGITPFDKNAFGVNSFKVGFGGKIIEYLGEWEISNSKLLSFVINKIYL